MSSPSRTWTLQKLRDVRCIEVGDCWEWSGSTNSSGHPMMSYMGKPSLARRVAWCLRHKCSLDDIKGTLLWNACANRLCINPSCTRSGSHVAMFSDLVRNNRLKASPSKRAKCAQIKRAASSLSMDDVRAIRAALAAGARRADLAAQYKKSDSLIARIAANDVWRETAIPQASIFSMGAA